MKLDPKLLRQLEERGDGNELLAVALGVCPTCGQPMRGAKSAAVERRKPKRRPGELKAAILDYLSRDVEYGNQSRCARALDVEPTYVNRVWNDHNKVSTRKPSSKRNAIVEWINSHPDGTYAECGKAIGVSRAYVSVVMQREPRNGEGKKDDGQG